MELASIGGLAPSTGPTRVGAPEDEGRAIPWNIVV
jgi:hypothetical protein